MRSWSSTDAGARAALRGARPPAAAPRAGARSTGAGPRAAAPCAALCLAALLLAAVAARGQAYVYALNEKGHLSVNGSGLGRLLSGFKIVEEDVFGFEIDVVHAPDQRWWDLFVDGEDRYTIRRDGRVSRNGEKLFTLIFDDDEEFAWSGIALAGGDVWALRSDGRVSRNGSKAVRLPNGGHLFLRLLSDGAHAYHLRTDGSLYVDEDEVPRYVFDGPGPDGGEQEHQWRDLAVHDGRLLALRQDGVLVSAASDGSDPLGGVPVTELPYDGLPNTATLYADLAVRANGDWLALAGSGDVYGSRGGDDGTLLVDLPSGPATNTGHRYVRIVPRDDSFVVLRRDGQLFDGTAGTAILDLKNNRYRSLAVSDVAPDLSAVKNQRPVVTRYQAVVREGQPLALPVLAVDRDRAAADLVVTPDLSKLPPEATWDDAARQLVWDAPGPPGRYKLRVTVDDGIGKPVKVAFPIHVLATDGAPKNRPPRGSAIRKARAQLQQPLALAILATDPDGDALTITPAPGALPAGAVFDAGTATLDWTPDFDQLGRHVLEFVLDDGQLTRVLRVKLHVETSLLPW